ncbi:MAG: T9SS type A sorting domain-containing protein [Ignavibacteria bacterium]
MRKFLLDFVCSLVITNVLWNSSTIYGQEKMAYVSFCEKTNEHPLFNVIDTVMGNWSYIAPLSQPLYGVNSYYWSDSNKVFVCGGANSAGVSQFSCFFYDPSANVYAHKAPLPIGRALGKLVRVRDSLYLVGSVGTSFLYPDGLIYKYDPRANTWVLKDTMPPPFLHEMAACVWKDSLIFTICGSTSRFGGITNRVMMYNPFTDKWKILASSFPQSATTSHAECVDSVIVVIGGVGTAYLNTVHRGAIRTIGASDSITISWSLYSDLSETFGTGVYRVGGGKWGDYMLFGPALRGTVSYNQIYGLRIADTSWTRFLPNTIDTAANRPTIAVKTQTDTIRFFLFGGFAYPNVIANSERYAFSPGVIGISSNNTGIPRNYSLSQNYPNPFNANSKIKFDLPLTKGETKEGAVTLKIYDILGREVAVLVNEKLKPGSYEVDFDGTNYPSGVYFYRIITDEFTNSKKMLLIK